LIPSSLLSTTRLHPVDIGGSVLVHGFLASLLAFAKICAPETGPLLSPDEVMEVKMVALPRSESALPDRASRAPRPSSGAPESSAPPLAPDQKTIPSPDAERPEGQTLTDHSDARQALMRDLRRKQLVDALSDAPVGPEDRSATDPDSPFSSDMVIGWGTGEMGDPELARYAVELRQTVTPHWSPLPRLLAEHPDLYATVGVILDDEGRVKKAEIARSSGFSSYDESCLRAVRKAARLPLPPPKFAELASQGFGIGFRAQDAM